MTAFPVGHVGDIMQKFTFPPNSAPSCREKPKGFLKKQLDRLTGECTNKTLSTPNIGLLLQKIVVKVERCQSTAASLRAPKGLTLCPHKIKQGCMNLKNLTRIFQFFFSVLTFFPGQTLLVFLLSVGFSKWSEEQHSTS